MVEVRLATLAVSEPEALNDGRPLPRRLRSRLASPSRGDDHLAPSDKWSPNYLRNVQ